MRLYIDKTIGFVGSYDDFYYYDENDNEVNAVDRKEVVEITLDEIKALKKSGHYVNYYHKGA